MSPSPDWYPDPTHAERLRYWDGVLWTQWVSTDGDTSQDAIAGASPPPPIEGRAGWSGSASATSAASPEPARATLAAEPVAAAPGSEPARAYERPQATSAPASEPFANTPRSLERPGAPPASRAGSGYSASTDQLLLRSGLGVAAIGGIVATFSVGQLGSSQSATGIEMDVGGGAFTALAGAILIVATAAAPWFWAQITGIAISTVLAVGLAFAVITFRTDGDYLENFDVSLGSGGWVLLTGALIAFVGLAVALAGIAVRPPAPRGGPPDKGKGVAALILGIAGFPVPFVASLGVTFGLLGMAEGRGAKEGRGFSIAGFVVGIIALSIWSFGLILAMFFAQPTA